MHVDVLTLDQPADLILGHEGHIQALHEVFCPFGRRLQGRDLFMAFSEYSACVIVKHEKAILVDEKFIRREEKHCS